ncbi:Y-f.2 family protein [Megaselia abdita]
MHIIGVLISVFILNVSNGLKLQEQFSWSKVEFNWPSLTDKKNSLQSGHYIPKNNVILGIERWKDVLFVTVPRWKFGVASTLNYIHLSDTSLSPKLTPYPSWETNLLSNEPSESSLVSTYRIKVDECDRLWVVDDGIDNFIDGPTQIAPAAIVIFDLNRNQLIRRFIIPHKLIKPDSFLANTVIDTPKDDCDNSFAYIADAGAFGIIVYSFKENRAWKIHHNFFHIDPMSGLFKVSDISFTWNDGVFGMALHNLKHDSSREVFFHSLSGTKEFVVSNEILKNDSYAISTDTVYEEFRVVGDRGEKGHSTTEVLDRKNNVMFFTQVARNGIGCWNLNSPLNSTTAVLVDSDAVSLIMPIDITLDREGFIWVVSNRMPHFLHDRMDFEDNNYRILVAKSDDLIKGTICDIN